MTVVLYVLALLVGLLGLVFVVGAQGQFMRLVVGGILLVAGGVFVFLARSRPRPSTIVQKIDLSGDVGLENLKCRSCGGALSKDSIAVKAGAVFVQCPYCGAAYQMEEQAKW